jgi:hypothetical protein
MAILISRRSLLLSVPHLIDFRSLFADPFAQVIWGVPELDPVPFTKCQEPHDFMIHQSYFRQIEDDSPAFLGK